MAAAGTVTHTPRQSASGSIARHEIAWVSDASGNVTSPYTSGSISRITGIIQRVEWVPDTGGTKPSDNFDVTLKTESGIDIFAAQGANIDADAPADFCPGVSFTDGTTTSIVPPSINDTLVLDITNAGNAKGGKIVLYTKDA